MKKPIMLVGDVWGREEEEKQAPFVGYAGQQLRAFLRDANISENDCYFTNCFNLHPPGGNDIKNLCGSKAEGLKGLPALEQKSYLLKKYEPELDRLVEEIKDVDPNVIVALGNTACIILFGEGKITNLRGRLTTAHTGHKVIPTYHPAAVVREWRLRPNTILDLMKAKRESHSKEYRRPSRYILYHPTLQECEDFYEKYLKPAEKISIDIETKRGQITYIGFAPSAERALVIPFINIHTRSRYWDTFEKERAAWLLVARILASPAEKIGQNFTYDMTYLWQLMGLPVRNFLHDAMLKQHAMFPEELKGLGYLASIHTDEASWKFMREKNSTVNKDGN